MRSKPFLLFLLVVCSHHLKSQKSFDRIFVGFGFSAIPLYINRTDVTRWMVHPTFEGGYRINKKLIITASYLGYDIRINNFSGEDSRQYKEVPRLTSYDVARMHLGKKYTLSLFNDYVFAGIQYAHYSTKLLNLRSNVQLGYRFGETSVLTAIFENPSWPNGFEVYSNILSCNSPGLKLSVSPRLILFDLVSLEISMGSFVFVTWPALQPYGNFIIGLSL